MEYNKLKGEMNMNKKLYLRSLAAQGWYNFTEGLVYALTVRPTPQNLIYERKLRYGKDNLQYINTYCKKGTENEKKPLFVYIHGGGWLSGITEMRNRYVSLWADKGYFTACVSYGYAPQKTFPMPVQDCFCAMDFISENAEKWNIDLDNVILAGESAGGYFISHVASAVSDFSLYEKNGLTFNSRDRIKIKALVGLSGGYNFSRMVDEKKGQSTFPDIKIMCKSYLGKEMDELREWLKTEEAELVSPKITPDFPPMYMAWATRDRLKFETFDMAKDLCNFHIPYRLFKVDDISAQHAWTTMPIFKKSKECFEDAFEFAEKYLD